MSGPGGRQFLRGGGFPGGLADAGNDAGDTARKVVMSVARFTRPSLPVGAFIAGIRVCNRR